MSSRENKRRALLQLHDRIEQRLRELSDEKPKHYVQHVEIIREPEASVYIESYAGDAHLKFQPRYGPPGSYHAYLNILCRRDNYVIRLHSRGHTCPESAIRHAIESYSDELPYRFGPEMTARALKWWHFEQALRP